MIGFAVKQWICTTQKNNNHNSISPTNDHSDFESYHAPLLGDIPSSTNHSTNDLFMPQNNNGNKNIQQPSPQNFFMALGKLGLIMAYFFLCDR